MTVNKFLMPFLVIASLFASVAIAQVTGGWSVSGKQLLDVQKLSSGDDVRGWMTLQQLSDGFGIPQDTLYSLLGIPSDMPIETALKDMESVLPDFEVSAVREAINNYLSHGGTQDAVPDSELTPIPEGIVDQTIVTLENEANVGNPTESSSQVDGTHVSLPAVPSDGILPAADIKGRHTLQEIVDKWNIPASDLLAALELPADVDMSTQVKDLAAHGLTIDVQNVRDIVSALQNR